MVLTRSLVLGRLGRFSGLNVRDIILLLYISIHNISDDDCGAFRCIIQAKHAKIDFDFLTYAKLRFDGYYLLKERCLKAAALL